MIGANCLVRAEFLLDHVDGVRGRVHAADLFESGAEYSEGSIAKEFKRIKRPGLGSGNSIRKLLDEIREDMERRVDETRGLLGVEPVGEMVKVVDFIEIGSPFRFGDIAFLCGKNFWFEDRLRRVRKDLSNPPVPRFTPISQRNYAPILDAETALGQHYMKLLGLAYPWRVSSVNDYKDPTEVTVARYPSCPVCGKMGIRIHPGTDSESTTDAEDAKPISKRISRRILAMQAEVKLNMSPFRCNEHGVIGSSRIDLPEIAK